MFQSSTISSAICLYDRYNDPNSFKISSSKPLIWINKLQLPSKIFYCDSTENEKDTHEISLTIVSYLLDRPISPACIHSKVTHPITVTALEAVWITPSVNPSSACFWPLHPIALTPDLHWYPHSFGPRPYSIWFIHTNSISQIQNNTTKHCSSF